MTKYVQKLKRILNLPALTRKELLHNSCGGDGIRRELIKTIVEYFGIKTIIETGTHMGSTSYFCASNFPDINIYSCEINEDYFSIASRNLKGIKNIRLSLSNSADFIKQATSEQNYEEILFYLDAHWDNYWPLLEEIKIISENVSSCVIIIDDCMVPNSKDYAFAFNGGKETSAAPGQEYTEGVDIFNLPNACSLDLITPFLSKEKHTILFPDYTYTQMKEYNRNPVFGNLIGYVCIIQNYKNVDAFMSAPLVNNYYKLHNL